MLEVQTRRHRRRSSRNRRRELRRAAISVVAAFAVVAAFVAAVLILEPLNAPQIASHTPTPEPVISNDLVLEAARNDSARVVYPYSVIPGGVYSPEELAAASATDPVVTAHYGDVVAAAMRVEKVDAPREAYMSYRLGDRIYWTKRKLALHDGERVLTDGRVTVRARCGNRLADEPMLPTSDAEPPVDAFEPVPEVPDLIARSLPLSAMPPMEPGMAPPSSSDPWDAIPFLGGIGWFGGVGSPLTDKEAGNPADDESDPPIAFVLPPSTGGGDGHYSDEGPLIVQVPGLTPLNPPSDDHPPNNPGGPPLGGPAPPVGGSNGELLPPVVPEPTSLTLFGTGAVWLAIKRYRQRRRSL